MYMHHGGYQARIYKDGKKSNLGTFACFTYGCLLFMYPDVDLT